MLIPKMALNGRSAELIQNLVWIFSNGSTANTKPCLDTSKWWINGPSKTIWMVVQLAYQHWSNGITMCVQNQWAFLKVDILNGFKWSVGGLKGLWNVDHAYIKGRLSVVFFFNVHAILDTWGSCFVRSLQYFRVTGSTENAQNPKSKPCPRKRVSSNGVLIIINQTRQHTIIRELIPGKKWNSINFYSQTNHDVISYPAVASHMCSWICTFS